MVAGSFLQMTENVPRPPHLGRMSQRSFGLKGPKDFAPGIIIALQLEENVRKIVMRYSFIPQILQFVIGICCLSEESYCLFQVPPGSIEIRQFAKRLRLPCPILNLYVDPK